MGVHGEVIILTFFAAVLLMSMNPMVSQGAMRCGVVVVAPSVYPVSYSINEVNDSVLVLKEGTRGLQLRERTYISPIYHAIHIEELA